jgi:hypothetical protein
MKLPVEQYYYNSDTYKKLVKLWKNNAQQLSVETGVFIEVHLEYAPPNNVYLMRIYFKVDDHEFEGLNDVKKAIEMKAFL